LGAFEKEKQLLSMLMCLFVGFAYQGKGYIVFRFQMDSARRINQLINFCNALEHDIFQCFQPIK
jgi:hypothetical protein